MPKKDPKRENAQLIGGLYPWRVQWKAGETEPPFNLLEAVVAPLLSPYEPNDEEIDLAFRMENNSLVEGEELRDCCCG
jgi:hypothetical protein